MTLEEKMEKLYVCYLMDNLIDDICDTKRNINLYVCDSTKNKKTEP